MTTSDQFGRVGRNTGYNMLRSVVSSAVAFATGVVVARALGPADTGIYALVVWIALATTIVFAHGLALTLTKLVARQDADTGSAEIGGIVAFGIKLQVLLAALGASALALAAGVLADAFQVPGSEELFVLAALFVACQALMDLFSAPITGLERQGLLVPLKTIWVVAQLAASTFVLYVVDSGLTALVVAQVVVVGLVAALHFAVLRRVVSFRGRSAVTPAMRRRIVRSSLSLTVSSTLGLVVTTRSAVLLLGYFATSEDVAFYSIAYSMADALQLMVPTALAFAVMPAISRALGNRQLEFARRAYERQLRLTMLAITPVAVGGAVLSSSFIHVFYGSAFGKAAVALSVLLFSAGLRALALCVTWVLVGSDRERLVVVTYAVCVAVNLGLGFALIPSLGIAGALIAEAATQLALLTTSMALVWKTVGFGIPAVGFARAAAACIPVLVTSLLVVELVDGDLVTLVFAVAAAPPAYALGLRLSGALSPFEKEYLLRRVAFLRERRSVA
jgi:O-antigen/teichoic acid export membrane protein